MTGLFIIGILYLYFSFPKIQTSTNFPIMSHFKKNCSDELVQCIDSCDFLCGDHRFVCESNVCQLPNSRPNIECDTDKGGMIVLKEFTRIPIRACVCKYPMVFDGPSCNIKSTRICENGSVSVYHGSTTTKFKCTCPPNTMLLRKSYDGFPHCFFKTQFHFHREFFPDLDR